MSAAKTTEGEIRRLGEHALVIGGSIAGCQRDHTRPLPR
jgi:hypothetical protein